MTSSVPPIDPSPGRSQFVSNHRHHHQEASPPVPERSLYVTDQNHQPLPPRRTISASDQQHQPSLPRRTHSTEVDHQHLYAEEQEDDHNNGHSHSPTSSSSSGSSSSSSGTLSTDLKSSSRELNNSPTLDNSSNPQVAENQQPKKHDGDDDEKVSNWVRRFSCSSSFATPVPPKTTETYNTNSSSDDQDFKIMTDDDDDTIIVKDEVVVPPSSSREFNDEIHDHLNNVNNNVDTADDMEDDRSLSPSYHISPRPIRDGSRGSIGMSCGRIITLDPHASPSVASSISNSHYSHDTSSFITPPINRKKFGRTTRTTSLPVPPPQSWIPDGNGNETDYELHHNRQYEHQQRMLDMSLRSNISSDDIVNYENITRLSHSYNNVASPSLSSPPPAQHYIPHRANSDHPDTHHSRGTSAYSASIYSDYTSSVGTSVVTKDTHTDDPAMGNTTTTTATTRGDIEVPRLAEIWWTDNHNGSSNQLDRSYNSHSLQQSPRTIITASESNYSRSNHTTTSRITRYSTGNYSSNNYNISNNSNNNVNDTEGPRNWREMLLLPFHQNSIVHDGDGRRVVTQWKEWTPCSILLAVLTGLILIVGLFILLLVAFKQVRDL